MRETACVKRVLNSTFTIDIYIDPYNKRIRLDDYHGHVPNIIKQLEKLTDHLQIEKLIIIGRVEDFTTFMENGFQCEAMVDRYYSGSDAYYFTKYLVDERKLNPNGVMEDEMINNVYRLGRDNAIKTVPADFTLLNITNHDATNLAKLYKEIFPIYPTPLHDPKYIEKTLNEGTIYYAYTHNGTMISAASAEMNNRYHNAELTDCATVKPYRQYGLMKNLLTTLQSQLKQRGIYCAYSIARAQSFGMNAALYQLGFSYRGRLVNNCNILSKLENMNMWVKDLSADETL